MVLMRWGWVPSWAKDEKSGYRTINARAETVAQKPIFKGAVKKRRCLVPADGYYEWQKQGKQKLLWRFVIKSGDTFSFAGLWDHWKKLDGQTLYTFTIITTIANSLAQRINDRMPVILHRQDEARWLDGSTDLEAFTALLKPYPSKEMRSYPISPKINSAANEGPEFVTPIEPV